MTYKEAADILDPETRIETLVEIGYYNGFNSDKAQSDAVNEACRIAAEVLRHIDNFYAGEKWISVKDRLPEAGKDVLVFANGKANAFVEDTTIEITKYANVSLFPSTVVRMGWRSPYQYFFDNYEITHWMPMPEPPVKGE